METLTLIKVLAGFVVILLALFFIMRGSIKKKNETISELLQKVHQRDSKISSYERFKGASVEDVFGKKPYLVIPKVLFDKESDVGNRLLSLVYELNRVSQKGTFLHRNYFVLLRGENGRIVPDTEFNPKKYRTKKTKK